MRRGSFNLYVTKASEERDAKQLKLLLALADLVPYKLVACKDRLEGWFAAWQIQVDQEKQADVFSDAGPTI